MTSSWRLVGVVLNGDWPISRACIELRPGLTVLSGRNGAGKTRLLDGVRSLLLSSATSADVDQESACWEAYGSAGGVIYNTSGHPDEIVKEARRDAALDDDAPGDSGSMTDRVQELQAILELGEWTDQRVIEAGERAGIPGPDVTRLLERGLFWITGAGVAWLAAHPSDPWLLQWRHDHPVDLEWEPNWSAKDRYEAIVDPPVFPPDPNHLGLEAEPPWAGTPILRLGHPADPLGRFLPLVVPDLDLTDNRVDLNASTQDVVQQLVSAAVREDLDFNAPSHRNGGTPPTLGSAADLLAAAASTQAPWVQQVCDELASIANDILERSVPGPPSVRLELHQNPPYCRWTASDAFTDGPLESLDQLSRAERRWVGFAIGAAIASDLGDDPNLSFESAPSPDAVAIIDEPERSLAPLAVSQVADNLHDLGAVVLVATHSPEVIAAGDTRILVERGRGGIGTSGKDLAYWWRDASAARATGVSAAHLAPSWRLLILVEGPHDQAVVREFCPDVVERANVHLVCLGGTYGLSHLAEAHLLFELSNAQLLVVTDNARAAWLAKLHEALLAAKGKRPRHSLLQQHRGRVRTPEEAALLSMLSAAIEADTLERFEAPFAFNERDIVHYLPASGMLPGATSWDEIARRFLQASGLPRMMPGDGKKLKDWVSSQPGGSYRLPRITEVARDTAASMRARAGGLEAHRPAEFSELATRVDDLLDPSI